MKLFKKIWDYLWLHHSENDCINIRIVQGKDHHHLTIKIRNIERVLEEEIKDKEIIIQKINKFLDYFKNNVIDYKTDIDKIKTFMEDKNE